jgi:hypothetical protein
MRPFPQAFFRYFFDRPNSFPWLCLWQRACSTQARRAFYLSPAAGRGWPEAEVDQTKLPIRFKAMTGSPDWRD